MMMSMEQKLPLQVIMVAPVLAQFKALLSLCPIPFLSTLPYLLPLKTSMLSRLALDGNQSYMYVCTHEIYMWIIIFFLQKKLQLLGVQAKVSTSVPCQQEERYTSCYNSNSKMKQVGGSNCSSPSQCSSKKEQCTELSPVECYQPNVLLPSPSLSSSLYATQDDVTDSTQPWKIQADHSVTSGFKDICQVKSSAIRYNYESCLHQSLISEATRRAKSCAPSEASGTSVPSKVTDSLVAFKLIPATLPQQSTACTKHKGKPLQRKRPLSNTINIPPVKKRGINAK